MLNHIFFRQNLLSLCILVIFTTAIAIVSEGSEIPHLRKQGTATQLIVDGELFLMLGGELGNSSSSSLEYMKPIWPKLVEMHLNTVLVPVYWELIEPEEGKFNFTLVDGLIKDARRYNLRLVLLWFASWKNSMSCYAPAWVKTNQQRFSRAQKKMAAAWKSSQHLAKRTGMLMPVLLRR
jgi:beta-galactosidase GanA